MSGIAKPKSDAVIYAVVKGTKLPALNVCMVRVPALRLARHTAASPAVPHQLVSIPVTLPSLPNAYLITWPGQ